MRDNGSQRLEREGLRYASIVTEQNQRYQSDDCLQYIEGEHQR
jgi:hypothetical protein